MIDHWIRWLTAMDVVELMLLLAPMFLLDVPRYALGTLAVWICDFVGHLANTVTGRDEVQPYYHQPSCCAVVAGLNEADSLGQTLESLAGVYPDLQIVIVDDGSTDGMSEVACEFAKRHPNTTVVRKPTRGGKSSALNAALPFTDAEILICVDSDSHLSQGAIWEIVQPFVDPRVAAVSGAVLVRKPFTNLLTWIQALEYYRCIFLGRMFTSRMGILGIVSGAFGAYRRHAILQVGAWDVGPGEDGDLTLRLRRAGYDVVFAPYAQCLTNPVQDVVRLSKQRRRWEWAVVTLECRKHIDMANPFRADFRLSNWLMIVERWMYGIVLQYAFLIYVLWQAFHLQQYFVHQCFLYYVVYLIAELMQVFLLLYYCDNRRNILSIALVIPLMPLYYIWMRCITIWAVSEELVYRRSYRDNFVPAHVRNVTWHW
ncbi:MAG: glycosyltransferase family 2 protein [Pirellulaceae bacterium]|nr:glycosyltransferase family 2 protein [Pirellulaceae bacterium]